MHQPARSFLFYTWPRIAVRHPWRVVGGALLALVLLIALSKAAGGSFSDSFNLPNSEAQSAYDLLKARFPQRAGDSATIVVKADGGLTSPDAHTRIDDLMTKVRALPNVVDVASPYSGSNLISADGKIARMEVQYDRRANAISDTSAKALVDLSGQMTSPGFQVEAGGQIAQKASRPNFGLSELVGIAAAVVILVIAFGSVVAMGLPIITAILALASGSILILLGANFFDMPSFTLEFGAMIGLGVGIDYSLLIVTRYREGLAHGMSVEDAVTKASTTAGRSVLFAGSTVVIAMLGLWLVGIPFVAYLGTAAAIVVLMAVLVALVVLPAILRLLGHRIDSLGVPGIKPVSEESQSGAGYRLSRAIQRRPLPFAIFSLGLLLLLAVPLLSLEVGSSDAGNGSTQLTTRRAYDLLSEGFGPGFNGPILVAFSFDTPQQAAGLEKLGQQLRDTPGVEQITQPQFNSDRTAATVNVIPSTSPQSRETKDLVHRIRDEVSAATRSTGAKGYVGGSTASFIDIGDTINSRLPFFFAAVIGLSFLLLCVVFRSVLIALKAALMNVLAIGASFGVLVAVFQWGWLGGLLNVKGGPIESFLPMFMFAVLFGLSMDYEVFLVGRIQEEYLRTRNNAEAVARGLSVTTRLITAAAAIMVSVFLSFAFGDQRTIKEFGIGLAAAIFVDATLIRLVLVPALMQLMGAANWWFPEALDRRLPRFHLEAHLDPEPETASS